MQRLPTRLVDYSELPDGAVEVVGGVLVNDPSGGGGGATVLGDLTDVDTTTTPPSAGQVLKFDGSLWVPDTDVAGGSSGPTGRFRGLWQADAVAAVYDFTSGIPAVFSLYNAGAFAVAPVTASASEVTGSSGGYSTAVKMQNKNVKNIEISALDLNLSATGIANVTRVTALMGRTSGSYSSSCATRIRRNGAIVTSTSDVQPWYSVTTTATSTDVIRFSGEGTNAASANTVSSAYVTGVAVYAAEDPYMIGDFVAHLGRLWRSVVDNNSSTPGTGANWVEVPLGYDQAVTTANRPTGIAAGGHVFDTTLGKPVWWNGTAWVDSAGTTV